MMAMRRTLTLSLALILGLFLVITAACTKKTGIERSEQATTSMQTVDSSMKQASTQIDVTNASLDNVIKTGQSGARPDDIKKSLDAYADNVSKMKKMASTVNSDLDEMNTRSNEYFQEWSKAGGTYTNPQISELSAGERMRLNEAFRNINIASAGLKGNLNSYVSQLDQIQTFLSHDLTATGIAQAAPLASSAIRQGDSVKQSFIPVQTAIAQTRMQMTPGGAAAGGPVPYTAPTGTATGGTSPAMTAPTGTATGGTSPAMSAPTGTAAGGTGSGNMPAPSAPDTSGGVQPQY